MSKPVVMYSFSLLAAASLVHCASEYSRALRSNSPRKRKTRLPPCELPRVCPRRPPS